MKNKKQQPQIIAWTDGLSVIPFENVNSVNGDTLMDGTVAINVGMKDSKGFHSLSGDNAKEFNEQYLHYLAFVEALTIDMGESDPEPPQVPTATKMQTRDGRAL